MLVASLAFMTNASTDSPVFHLRRRLEGILLELLVFQVRPESVWGRCGFGVAVGASSTLIGPKVSTFTFTHPKIPTPKPNVTSPSLQPCTNPPAAIMGIAFDVAPDRPENIDTILNGLDRYNPETTAVFQEYVAQQCENQTYDCYANLALLKL